MPTEKVLPKEGKLIGKISHYFSKIEVAVIDLDSALKTGDTLRIVGGEVDFNQVVDSMEIDRKKVEKAGKGDAVGMKVSQKVREGYKVYKI